MIPIQWVPQKLEHGFGMVCAGFPSFRVGLEDSHVEHSVYCISRPNVHTCRYIMQSYGVRRFYPPRTGI